MEVKTKMTNELAIDEVFSEDTEVHYSRTQRQIIDLIETDGPQTRRQFVTKLGIARTTIYDNLVKLQKKNIVEKYSVNNGQRGRPLTYWKLEV